MKAPLPLHRLGRPVTRNRLRARWAWALTLVTAILACGLGLGWAQESATVPGVTAPDLVLPATAPTTAPAAVESQPATTSPASAPAGSQPTSRRASTRPVTSPNSPLSLNFQDASLRSVLEYLSEAAGLIIIEDAKVEGRVSIISKQDISVNEAVSLLDTVLREKGYAAIRTGRTLKIVTLEQAKKEMVPVQSGNDPTKLQVSDRVVTQIIPIRYADAVRLKADLATLIPATTDVSSNASSNTLIVTGSESSIRHIVEIISAIDVHMSEVSQVKVFQLKFANASNAARLISEIFKEDQTGGSSQANPFAAARRSFMAGMGGGGFGGGAGGRNAGGGGAAVQETGQRGVKVTASADDRTNALVVSASPDVLKVIADVVKELDANPAETQAVFIYRLKNGRADNLQTVLNNIFGTGTGSSGNTANRNTSPYANAVSGGAFGSRGGSGGGGAGGGRGLSGGGTTPGSNRPGGSTQGGFGGGARLSAASSSNAADLTGQVFVVADLDTNSLAVTTASKNFERVKGIITDLDRPVPQVLIKVLIAEVTHTNTLDLGLEFSGLNLYGKEVVSGLAVGNQVPVTTVNANGTVTTVVPKSIAGRGENSGTDFGVAAARDGFTFRLDEKYVSAALHAIAGVAKLDVLSRPYILTGDNQQASIMVGQEVPFIVNSRTTDTGQTINTIEYDDIGIILQVTPHINTQGLVTMDVYPEISTLTGETVPISAGVSAPVFAKRFAQSRVAVRDGQTIVIGGLMQDTSTKSIDKVPFLGDIPGIGVLFQHVQETKSKTELLIFLTPHVAQQPDDLKGMSESELGGAKLVGDAVTQGAFQEHMKGMARGAATQPCAENAEPQIELHLPPPPEAVPEELPSASDSPQGANE